MRQWAIWTSGAALVAALAMGACAGPEHLGREFGWSYHAAFGAQAVRDPTKPTKAGKGLDPQEAAIVADGYRRSLALKGTSAREEPVLFVAPSGSTATPLPPPSVPGGK